MRRAHRWAPVVISLCVMALLLGVMRPLQMGLPFLVAALCALAVAAAFGKQPRFAPAAIAGSCSSSLYPATLVGGLLSHSFYLSNETMLIVTLTAAITVAACLLVIGLLTETH